MLNRGLTPPQTPGAQVPRTTKWGDPISGPETTAAAGAYRTGLSGQGTYVSNIVSPKSKTTAGLLGILTNWFGIHNFYLGQKSKGLTKLVIDLLGILLLIIGFASISATAIVLGYLALGAVGLWSFIEGILILSSSPGSKWNRDGDGYPMN